MSKLGLIFWFFWILMSFVTGGTATLAMLTAHFLLVVWLFLPETDFAALVFGRAIIEKLGGGTYDEEDQRKLNEMQAIQARNERVSWWLVILNNVVMVMVFGAVTISMYLIYVANLGLMEVFVGRNTVFPCC